MFVILFIKALFLGFLVAAPVGPVGALVIRRTLHRGPWLGFATGTGSAMGDTLYALVVATGLSTVQHFLVAHTRSISFVGGMILLVMGARALVKNFRERDETPSAPEEALKRDMDAKTQEIERKFETGLSAGHAWKNALKASMGSFLLTISNPVTIVGFAGSFAAFGFWSVDAPRSISDPRYILVVGGVLIGSLLWWVSLSSLVHWLGNRLSKNWIFKIHVTTSLVIVISGLLCLARGALL